jgi:cytidine deaminase
VAAAREAARESYAPYSRYAVGAALLTAGGVIVTGCNVENSSYGLAICAERNAVFAARARGLADPKTAPIAAIAIHAERPPTGWPCGACRQVLHEFGTPGMPVIVDGPGGRTETTLGELLPRAFSLDDR